MLNESSITRRYFALKIESVVEGVFKQLKEHGLSEYTLQQNMWSYYRAIIKFHVTV